MTHTCFTFCHSSLSLYIFLMYIPYLCPHGSGWVVRRLCLRMYKSARRKALSAKRIHRASTILPETTLFLVFSAISQGQLDCHLSCLYRHVGGEDAQETLCMCHTTERQAILQHHAKPPALKRAPRLYNRNCFAILYWSLPSKTSPSFTWNVNRLFAWHDHRVGSGCAYSVYIP